MNGKVLVFVPIVSIINNRESIFCASDFYFNLEFDNNMAASYTFQGQLL